MSEGDERVARERGFEIARTAFKQQTGYDAPGVPTLRILSDGEKKLVAYAWETFVAKLALSVAGAPRRVDPDTKPGDGQRKVEFGVGDTFMLKGWKFKIEQGTERGFFAAVIGPANRVARRRAERENGNHGTNNIKPGE